VPESQRMEWTRTVEAQADDSGEVAKMRKTTVRQRQARLEARCDALACGVRLSHSEMMIFLSWRTRCGDILDMIDAES
jgi:hypothetical protein